MLTMLPNRLYTSPQHRTRRWTYHWVTNHQPGAEDKGFQKSFPGQSTQGSQSDVISELQYQTVKDKCRKGDYFMYTVTIGRTFINGKGLKKTGGNLECFRNKYARRSSQSLWKSLKRRQASLHSKYTSTVESLEGRKIS